jgi:nitronate monooxygenase
MDDWAKYDLATICNEIVAWLKAEELNIPIIAAGGIFTGSDATRFMENGSGAVQVATRFTVCEESGLPAKVRLKYFEAMEDDIVVNGVSPTGYPMRMLKNSPAIGDGIRPNCESYGYLLDDKGSCAYIQAFTREAEKAGSEKGLKIFDKTCLCTQMHDFNLWTCGSSTYRLKDTTNRLADGSYQMLTAEHVFKDYQFSKNDEIALPSLV